jgi:hypothetical protein
MVMNSDCARAASKSFPYLRLDTRRPGVAPRAGHVEVTVNTVALGQLIFGVLPSSSIIYYSCNFSEIIISHREL